jgi:energy-coupling factor transport system ATP-binding protein
MSARVAPLAELEDVWYAYDGRVAALRGVTLQLQAGERVALIGRNGSGKTTLAKQLNGLLRPQRGRVLVGGLDTSRHDVGRLARMAGYVFQNPDHQLFARTVREELAFGPRNLSLAPAEVEQRVAAALAEFSLEAHAGTSPALLGFAQRRLVALASVAAMQPALLVLDEPFAGLDWPSVERLIVLLAERARRGQALLLITHQMRAVVELAERCVVLEAGAVIADDDTRAVLTNPELLARAALVPPAMVRLGARLRGYGFAGRSLRVDEFVAEYRRVRAALAAHRPAATGDLPPAAPRPEPEAGRAGRAGRNGEQESR